jgi:hypothetical protein
VLPPMAGIMPFAEPESTHERIGCGIDRIALSTQPQTQAAPHGSADQCSPQGPEPSMSSAPTLSWFDALIAEPETCQGRAG